jgi:hypothetical protein
LPFHLDAGSSQNVQRFRMEKIEADLAQYSHRGLMDRLDLIGV